MADPIHHRAIPRLYVPTHNHPNITELKILPSEEKRPVQSFTDNVDYIPDFLRGESTARAVIATRCQFGWPKLSIAATCLYIDAENLTNIEPSFTNQATPTVIIRAELKHAGDNATKATKLITQGLDVVESSKQKARLKMNKIPRLVQERGRLFHGQSISLINDESKGSIAVFLATPDNENGLYTLTAYHVVPFKERDETRVITPGGLDSLTRVLAAITSKSPDNEVIGELLARREEPFGMVKHDHVNANQNGWQSDFALIHLNDDWAAKNGNWADLGTLTVFAIAAENISEGFTGTNGIVGYCDPQSGQICYKDGATTGYTVGVIESHDSLEFRKKTAEPAFEEDNHADIVVSKVLLVQPAEGGKIFCEGGDSGGGVFVSDPQADGWKWSGLLVSVLKIRDQSFGVMVPQSQVFQSLEGNIGMNWDLAAQNDRDMEHSIS